MNQKKKGVMQSLKPVDDLKDQVPDWKRMFPNANYEPDPNCKKCSGIGYIHTPAKYYGDVIIEAGNSPCICIFVHHDYTQMIGESLARVTKKMVEENGGPEEGYTFGNLLLAALKSFNE